MIRRVALLATILLGLVLALPGCAFRPREAPPEGLRQYLDALVDGRLGEAYEITQLGEVHEAFGDGSAVSQEHFSASWTSTPLRRYEIVEVVKLRRRQITDFGEGNPYFETQVRMITDLGSRVEQIAVEGEINPTVQIDPFPVRFASVDTEAAVRVDGVLVPKPRRDGGVSTLLLLPGRHSASFGNKVALTLDVQPLEVVTGDARVSDPANRVVSLS